MISTSKKITSCFYVLSLLIPVTYVFVMNSWISDDAYIMFRTVQNFIHGYGLTWNVGERVQVYTCPLWMFLISFSHVLTSDFYYTVLIISYFLLLSTIAILIWHKRIYQSIFLVTLLTSSKAFIDFTSSGLENPLSYLFIATFYAVVLKDEIQDADVEKRRLLFLYFIASLAFFNRQDTVLLYAAPLLFLTFKAFLSVRYRIFKFVLIGLLPAIIWELFSLIYYGFPFPNTYYAKLNLGLPVLFLMKQGLLYVLNSLLLDPITISVILTAICLSFFSKKKIILLSSISVLLYLTYTIKIGGDYMSGRFFSLPFLLSVIILDTLLKKKSRTLFLTVLLLLVVYNVILPHVPIKSDARLPWDHGLRAWGNITDEGGANRRSTNLLFIFPFGDSSVIDFPLMPLKNWADDGKYIRDNDANVILITSGIGCIGFFAGPEKHIIDSYAIADPLLARLPVPLKAFENFRHGHVVRDIPFGYGESLEAGRNLIADSNVRDYYDKIRIITQGDIFSLRRLECIAELNFKGKYDKPIEFAFTPKKHLVLFFPKNPSEVFQ